MGKNEKTSPIAQRPTMNRKISLFSFFFFEGVLLGVVAGRGIILIVPDYQGRPWRVDEMMVDGDGDGDGAGMCCNR